MTSVRAINPKTWDEIYELIGRIQYRAIESRDWETAKEADRVTAILRKLPEQTLPQERPPSY